jgi:hypothetical protein
MIGSIQPLVGLSGRYVRTDEPGVSAGLYKVMCRDCGDVTREESGFTTGEEVPIQQAGLYQMRHLARHLAALSNEMTAAAR